MDYETIYPKPEEESQAQPPMVYVKKNPTWEHKLIVRDLSKEQAMNESELDGLGDEGWELAGAFSISNLAYFYFKRMVD